jgi:polyribonucleotide nucleotidyltransferase
MTSVQFNIFTQDIVVDGKTITLETGELARSAGGSVLVKCGETIVMVNTVASTSPREGIDFFPLLVDYEEKMYAAGRLPGGYIKREGRPSEKAVLVSRLIDRPIRPLFPEAYRNDVQIVATPLSLDNENPPDILAILGASAALVLSGVPFLGPVGAVRIALVQGEMVGNPTHEQMDKSELDLIVAGTADSIMMVEAGADFVNEETLVRALEFAHSLIQEQVKAQEALAQKCGVKKIEFVPAEDLSGLHALAEKTLKADLEVAFHDFDREGRQVKVDAAKAKWKLVVQELPEGDPIRLVLESSKINFAGEAFKKIEKKVMRAMIMDENVRADGRKPEDVRPITARVGVLPRVHGSALFTRGNTQVLSICTLGSPGDAQSLDGIDPQKEKRWIHHYNFPGYSVGEVKPSRGVGRREIGHGALAERAVASSLPKREDFGYTLRVTSEVLESNGSTSMASTCAASLALMDAGVPVTTPVSGVAMGLIKENGKYVVLTDIQGVEDFLGDMDFKVTGHETGITALQMDIKIQGISVEIMRDALDKAKAGRLHILGKMKEALPQPRTTMSDYAPRMITLKIDTDQIGTVIGPGGKMIRSIIDQTGASIDIEDSGLVTITSTSGAGGEKARDIIAKLTMKINPGLITFGKVVRIIPAGAFIEIVPGKDGMVHISQLVPHRVEKVEDILSVGQEVLVKVNEIDDRGRINLTMKGLTPEERAPFFPNGDDEYADLFLTRREHPVA